MPDNENDLSRYEVQTRLIQTIIAMSDPEKRNLLKQLEESLFPEKRKHPRDPSLIPVECSSGDEVCFTDFIQDISSAGVFIKTQNPPSIGEKITLSFSVSDNKKPVTITGRIVRSDDRGFAVDFRRKSQE